MSERMTVITLPGAGIGAGLADYGRIPAAKMIAMMRRYAEHQKQQAEAILAACDDDFRIETHVGTHVKHRREVIQEGKTA